MSRRLQLHGRLGGIADGDEQLLATVSHYDVRAKIAIGEYRLRISLSTDERQAWHTLICGSTVSLSSIFFPFISLFSLSFFPFPLPSSLSYLFSATKRPLALWIAQQMWQKYQHVQKSIVQLWKYSDDSRLMLISPFKPPDVYRTPILALCFLFFHLAHLDGSRKSVPKSTDFLQVR